MPVALKLKSDDMNTDIHGDESVVTREVRIQSSHMSILTTERWVTRTTMDGPSRSFGQRASHDTGLGSSLQTLPGEDATTGRFRTQQHNFNSDQPLDLSGVEEVSDTQPIQCSDQLLNSDRRTITGSSVSPLPQPEGTATEANTEGHSSGTSQQEQ